MTKTASRIGEISLVIVPSADQDRAIEFYVEPLGFEKRTDIPFGGDYRWVEVYPPAARRGSRSRRRAPATRPSRADRHQPQTDDIDAFHAELRDARRRRRRRGRRAWATRCRRCSGSATLTATRCWSSRSAPGS